MQSSILRFFQNKATPFLDHVAEYTTMLGEEGVYILIIAVFFWAVSKRQGFIMASTLLLSLFLNSFLKLVFHTPRPFETLPDLEGKRLQTATGYSFPSGHTQGASSFYAVLIYLFKKKLLRVLCVAAVLLVGISRLYLGVHWPVDVLGGWILGVGTTWYIAARINSLWETPADLKEFLLLILGITAALTTVMFFLEMIFFKGSIKVDDYFKAAGMVLGCIAGFILETDQINFRPAAGGYKTKFLRVITGLIGAFLIQNGLKMILPDYFISHFFRYGIMGFWIVYLFPLLGLKAGLFEGSLCCSENLSEIS